MSRQHGADPVVLYSGYLRPPKCRRRVHRAHLNGIAIKLVLIQLVSHCPNIKYGQLNRRHGGVCTYNIEFWSYYNVLTSRKPLAGERVLRQGMSSHTMGAATRAMKTNPVLTGVALEML